MTLHGNDLPARWSGLDDFTVAEVGFDLGHNFLATWQAWHHDPGRVRRLHYVGLDVHPPALADLHHAHAGGTHADLARQLIDAWPPRTPGLHLLAFEGGALQLLLAFGDLQRLLSELNFQADAFYLTDSASAPGRPLAVRYIIQALSRRARPAATAAAGTAARALCEAMSARRVPHSAMRPVQPGPVKERQAMVVGAGLAGACVAAALAAQGFEVAVLERHLQPAGGSSGNPAGLFHATVHGDDGAYARLFRAGALHTARLVRELPVEQVPHQALGLLRLELNLSRDAMQARIARLGLPPDLVQALGADEASQRAGVALNAPCWFYPQGGWVAPAALVQHLLDRPGIRFIGGAAVQALHRSGDRWSCLGPQGSLLARAPHLVLANAEQANALLAPMGWPAFPWTRNRGQVSLFDMPMDQPGLQMPVAGAGYVLPLPGGRLLCGATTRTDGDDVTPLKTDHRQNLARLQALCGLAVPDDVDRWHGRVGWRVQVDDRLPVAGPVPVRQPDPSTRLDQARLVPREPGLHMACGFGARGITLAPLLGEVVAARIAGNPVPLEQALVDHVDPARWIVRRVRRPAAGASD